MVWPIDAQKGRFPSKITHSCGRDPILDRSLAQPDNHIACTTHKSGALLPATAVYLPLRGASECCSRARAVAADIACCNLQYCRLRLLRCSCSSRHRPLCSLRPLNIRQSKRAWDA